MKTIMGSLCFVVLCFLILNIQASKFNIAHELFEDENDNFQHEKRQFTNKQDVYWNVTGFNSYAKDNFYVYYMGKKIDVTSPSSFSLLGDGYGKDNFYIYYMGKKLTVTSPTSFKLLGNGYGKDNFYVYYMGQKIDVTSPSSFTAF